MVCMHYFLEYSNGLVEIFAFAQDFKMAKARTQTTKSGEAIVAVTFLAVVNCQVNGFLEWYVGEQTFHIKGNHKLTISG